ncbi:MAG TPA: YraN family protein [Candidatus Eubacterium faecavium]|nr:YraN family protein [Candidatus Eubacterium faecavium]
MNANGKLAEMKACEYLQKKKYSLVDFNYSCRFGEIDLIMKNKKYICFVEVKMRNEKSIASPMEFVDKAKQKKIAACAELYLASHKTKLQPRFDVVEVFCENNVIKSIKHLENAFQLY